MRQRGVAGLTTPAKGATTRGLACTCDGGHCPARAAARRRISLVPGARLRRGSRRVRPRRRRGACEEDRGHGVSRSQGPGSRLAPEGHLRPVARHSLSSGGRAVAREEAGLPGAVLPPRPVLRSHGADERRRGIAGEAGAFLAQPVRLRQERLRQPRPAGPRLRRLPRARADQDPRLLRRGDRLPRRDVLPRARPRRGLRPVRARPRHRHRRVARRGVPLVPGVLARAADTERAGADALRPARQPEPHRRVPLRREPPATRPS